MAPRTYEIAGPLTEMRAAIDRTLVATGDSFAPQLVSLLTLMMKFRAQFTESFNVEARPVKRVVRNPAGDITKTYDTHDLIVHVHERVPGIEGSNSVPLSWTMEPG